MDIKANKVRFNKLLADLNADKSMIMMDGVGVDVFTKNTVSALLLFCRDVIVELEDCDKRVIPEPIVEDHTNSDLEDSIKFLNSLKDI